MSWAAARDHTPVDRKAFLPGLERGAHPMGAPFVWFDLTAAGDQVHDFYSGLFGWPVRPGAGDYQGWFADGERPWAGTQPAGPAVAGRWIPYVAVDDLDAAAKQAAALGG